MSKKVLEVVGTMFFHDGKLLVDKPRNKPTYQMIGGKVEDRESVLEAAIRECHEELGDKAIFDESLFSFVMDFHEIATSDPNIEIHMSVFQYLGQLEGKLTTSREIGDFMWFGFDDDYQLLSNTLKNEVVPYAISKKLIYKK